MNAYFDNPEQTLLDAGLGARLAKCLPVAAPTLSVLPEPSPPAPAVVARNSDLEVQVLQGSSLLETMLTV